MTKPALLSSKEYSISPTPRGTQGVEGVIAVSIATETVEGVDGIGTGTFFGVLLSSSPAEVYLVGVETGVLLVGSIL